MHAGEEMLRTKEDENGEYVSDSVRSSDYVNSIKWDNLKKKEYYDVYEYYKGLIAFRKSHKVFMMSDAKEIKKKNSFIDTDDEKVIAYKLIEDDKEIYVIFNADDKERDVRIGSENDVFKCYINDKKAGNSELESFNGVVGVKGTSCKVLISALNNGSGILI